MAFGDVLIRDLELFSVAAQHSSFVAAAKAIGTSQAHISKRIKALETSLGVTLFFRNSRRVMVTSEGRILLEWAQRIHLDTQTLQSAFNGTTDIAHGTLRISSSQRLGRRHVGPALARLQKENPQLDIWLELLDRRVDLVTEGFDIDIRVGEVNEPGLIAHHIADTPRILCASPSYLAARGKPLSPQDLTNHDCLVFRDRDAPVGLWRLRGNKGWENAKVTGALATNDSEVALRWCLAGQGIVMMADWNLAPEISENRLVRVLPKWSQPANVWAVTAARSDQSAKIRVAIEFLKENLSSGPYALSHALITT